MPLPPNPYVSSTYGLVGLLTASALACRWLRAGAERLVRDVEVLFPHVGVELGQVTSYLPIQNGRSSTRCRGPSLSRRPGSVIGLPWGTSRRGRRPWGTTTSVSGTCST